MCDVRHHAVDEESHALLRSALQQGGFALRLRKTLRRLALGQAAGLRGALRPYFTGADPGLPHDLLGLVGGGPSVLFHLLSGLLADPLCFGLGVLQVREHWDQFG